MMKRLELMLAFAAFSFIASESTAGERSKSVGEATVFIRLVGNIHIEVEEFGLKQTADREHVEIGTGSGFVISPYGHVLTNAHVIDDGDLVVKRGTKTAKITVKMSKVEVCFPESSDLRGSASACAEASIYASDPELDVAVLFINATNLPYIALGDSDAVSVGQPISALGYPFGRQLEVGQAVTVPDLVPSVSTVPGTISATRAGDRGERRYLQVTSPVNPGNSGGPVVDRDGFAVGVIRMKVAEAAGIAFAIPINLVKNFLELRGVDQSMPTRRLRLGPFQSMEGKGVGLRLPEGLADTSPFRSRIETDATSSHIALRIDRVLSPWNLKQIEQTLVGSQSFERVLTATSESQMSSKTVLSGRATGTASSSNDETQMDYAIVDLDGEKLVARYIGPASDIAFNASVLRDSLISLDGQKIVREGVDPIVTPEWAIATAADGKSHLPIPAGWVIEPSAPSLCRGLPQANAVVTAFPPHDFSVAARAGVWSDTDFTPEQAAAMCSAPRASTGLASYASHADWLGVSYSIEGTFVRIGPRQIVQLEVIAPDRKSLLTHSLLAAWIKNALSPLRP
jgi:S1-C subfamily serine protease